LASVGNPQREGEEEGEGEGEQEELAAVAAAAAARRRWRRQPSRLSAGLPLAPHITKEAGRLLKPRICSLEAVGRASHCSGGLPAAATSANEVVPVRPHGK
jgi:hypothetical protein